MVKQDVIIFTDYSGSNALTREEISEIFHISNDFITELVHYGIVHPVKNKKNEWQFEITELKRIQKALRLQRDLEINLAGAALALDLLEELEDMRRQMALLEKHFLNL